MFSAYTSKVGFVLHGKAQMSEVWDHPNQKKFSQVLDWCIRAKEGSAGLPWTSIALHCKETLSGPRTQAISREVSLSVSSPRRRVVGFHGNFASEITPPGVREADCTAK
jgi:hypothetical protein